MTLTTCHPRFSARQRLVIHAALDGVGSAKTGGPDGPVALHEPRRATPHPEFALRPTARSTALRVAGDPICQASYR